MGICLDTDQQDGSQVFEEAGAQNTEKWRREAGILATPPGGNFPMRNSGPVNFEPPTVPVIFVLGGPGSGKVTHCDTLTQKKKGVVHINMTGLLQQYSVGNGMQDFALLSSKTLTEVLMLEMKMTLGAKTLLVSGYPRNMRDVVEYSEKIQIVNGVILVAWKREQLERQIEYGAQLGQVDIKLAKMELQNFYDNVMPVAEYFHQSGMLLTVNGERHPSNVYDDFQDTVMRILGLNEDGETPQKPVSSFEAEVDVMREQDGETLASGGSTEKRIAADSSPVRLVGDEILPAKTADIPRKGLPPIVWVLGGPGSDKAQICSLAVRKMPNWVHLNLGNLLVTLGESSPKIQEALVSGELVASDVAMQLVEQQILLNRDSDGIVLDGFPRDLNQAQDFENKFGQRPELLLLDVSKQQLNRGRVYDGVEAFERRLEVFRELALPMLKILDSEGRLSIVDGVTERPADRQQFASALLELMRRAARNEDGPNRIGELRPDDDEEEEQLVRRNAPNGVAKPIANGIDHRANDAIVSNGVAGGRKPLANGAILMKTAARQVIANDRQQKQQNGKKVPESKRQQQANGGPHLLQNGVAPRMGNGFLPAGNRVGPAPRQRQQNGVSTITAGVDPLRRMYSEVEGGYGQQQPPANLHI